MSLYHYLFVSVTSTSCPTSHHPLLCFPAFHSREHTSLLLYLMTIYTKPFQSAAASGLNVYCFKDSIIVYLRDPLCL